MSRRRKPDARRDAPGTGQDPRGTGRDARGTGQAPRRTGRDPRGTGRDARGVLRHAPEAEGRATRILRDVAVLLLAFGVGVGIAELFGAANLGVAFGVGQIVFAIALVVLLTRA
jgi:hypothetical protein